MYVISIANEKGGVAKTTTVISLGAALVELANRILLVDLDPQGSLGLSLGIEMGKVNFSVSDVLLKNSSRFQMVENVAGIEGLDLVPSSRDMMLVERFLPTQPSYETVIRDALRQEHGAYDFVLMDCPPYLGIVTLNALVASDLVITPTQPEYFSIYSLRHLMGLIRQVRTQNNPSLLYRLLLTMYDRRNRVHPLLSQQVRSAFKNAVFETKIEVDTKFRESSIQGLPILHSASKTRGSIQYRELAQELLTYVESQKGYHQPN